MLESPTELALAATLALLLAIGLFAIWRLRKQVGHATEARRLAEAKLEIVEFIAEVGTWEIDGATRAVDWSQQVFAIHHRNPALGSPSLADALGYYHPDHREMVGAAVQRSLDEGEDFEFHARIIDESGHVRHVLVRGAARFRHDKVAGVFGSFIEMRGAWEPVQEARAMVDQH